MGVWQGWGLCGGGGCEGSVGRLSGESGERWEWRERVWFFGERCMMVAGVVIAGFFFQRLFGRVDACWFHPDLVPFSFLHLIYLCRTLLKAGWMDFACGLVLDLVF